MLSRLLHPILGLSGWEAYLIVGALCFGEAAFLLGFVLPGETAVVLGGVLAEQHHVNLIAMAALVVFCAIAGDSVGYEVGRHFGPAILRLRPMRRPAVQRAQDFVRRRGPLAVFLGRFTAIFRAIVPGIAGMSGLSYPRFLAANAAGGIIWGITFTLAGYAVGTAYQKVLSGASTASYVIIGVAAAALVSWQVRSRLKEHAETTAFRDRTGALDAADPAEARDAGRSSPEPAPPIGGSDVGEVGGADHPEGHDPKAD